MSKHTPDNLAYEIVPSDAKERLLPHSKWTGLFIGPQDDDGSILHTIFEGGFTHGPEDGDPEADAERLIACWNACTGVPTSALSEGCFVELVKATELLLKTAQHFEKQASQGSGGRRGGPVFTKVRAALRPFTKED